MMETLLLGAKWIVYTLLCGGDYHRYMGLRAAAVRRLASRGWYERAHVRFLRSYLRAGDTAIDVGANLGAYSIAMAAAVGASGKVLAFEPLPEPYEWLCRNTRDSRQVTCFNVALSDHPAPALDMKIPLLFGKIPEPSLAGLGKAGTRYQTCRVPVATLDSYLDRFQRLAFIKVDVEGHELTFLQGARDTIARFRPLIQFESNNISGQYADFNSFARPLGYSVCRLESGGSLSKPETGATANGYNFYLVPDPL